MDEYVAATHFLEEDQLGTGEPYLDAIPVPIQVSGPNDSRVVYRLVPDADWPVGPVRAPRPRKTA